MTAKIVIAFLCALLIIAISWAGAACIVMHWFAFPLAPSVLFGFVVVAALYAICVWAMK